MVEAVRDGRVYEDSLGLPAEEEIIERDFRTCTCALTYVVRKRHGALGSAVEIRVCCMAKEVERMAGLPEGTFFNAMNFTPSWDWDCDQVSVTESKNPDGSVECHRHVLGAPPKWLLDRLVEKDRPIHNLEKHSMPGRKHKPRRLE